MLPSGHPVPHQEQAKSAGTRPGSVLPASPSFVACSTDRRNAPSATCGPDRLCPGANLRSRSMKCTHSRNSLLCPLLLSENRAPPCAPDFSDTRSVRFADPIMTRTQFPTRELTTLRADSTLGNVTEASASAGCGPGQHGFDQRGRTRSIELFLSLDQVSLRVSFGLLCNARNRARHCSSHAASNVNAVATQPSGLPNPPLSPKEQSARVCSL